MENDAPDEALVGENTNERMADRPPIEDPGLDAIGLIVDDTGSATGGVPSVDDV